MTPKEQRDTPQCANWTNSHDSQLQDLDARRRSPILVKWRNDAACLQVEPELFFPIGTAHPGPCSNGKAKAVCRRCKVVHTC